MKKIIYLLIVFFLIGCNFEDEEFLSKREINNSENLRLEGYYYMEKSKMNTYIDEYQNLKFLYRNGAIFGSGQLKVGEFFEYENETLTDTNLVNNLRRNKSQWGIYRINNDEIFIEKWVTIPGGRLVYIEEGKILNDTTFVITHSMHKHSLKQKRKYLKYHFRQFSPKPDSMNNFIE